MKTLVSGILDNIEVVEIPQLVSQCSLIVVL